MNTGVPRPITRLGGLLKVVVGLTILCGVAGSSFAQAKGDPEKERQEEQRRQEQARQEQARRQQEEQRRQEEARRAEQTRQEQARQEQQRQEQARQEQMRRAEEQRRADEARKADEARRAADARKADEERRKQQEASQRTNAFEQARQVREAEAKVREAKEREAKDQQKAAEQRRVDDARKADEERRKQQETAQKVNAFEQARQLREAQAKERDAKDHQPATPKQPTVNNFELGRQFRDALKKEPPKPDPKQPDPTQPSPKQPDKPVVVTPPVTNFPNSGGNGAGKLPIPKLPDRPPVVVVRPPAPYPPMETVFVGGESVHVCNPAVPIIVQIPIVIDMPASQPPSNFTYDPESARAAVPTNALGMPRGFSEDYASMQFQASAPKPKFNWKGAPEDWLANAGEGGWQTTLDLHRAMPGALIVWKRGYNGHVAVVDQIMPNGFIVVSEMNMGEQVSAKNGKTSGFGRVTRTVIDPSKPNRGIFKFGGLILPIRISR